METRQRRSFTDDYKRQAVDLVASSGHHAAEIARLQRENERLRMERDILKNFLGPLRACAG
jgi:transposase